MLVRLGPGRRAALRRPSLPRMCPSAPTDYHLIRHSSRLSLGTSPNPSRWTWAAPCASALGSVTAGSTVATSVIARGAIVRLGTANGITPEMDRAMEGTSSTNRTLAWCFYFDTGACDCCRYLPAFAQSIACRSYFLTPALATSRSRTSLALICPQRTSITGGCLTYLPDGLPTLPGGLLGRMCMQHLTYR